MPDDAPQIDRGPGDPGALTPAGPPRPRPTWTPLTALFGLVVAFVLSSFGALLILAVAGDEDSAGFAIGSQAVFALTLVGVAFGFATSDVNARQALRMLGLRRSRPGWVKLTGLSFLGFALFAALLSGFVAQPEQTDIADELGFDESVVAAVATGVLIVAAAPVAEEVFFRGFFFAGLRAAMPLVPAALISGALFGSIHLTNGNVAAAGLLAVLGALLAWLYERTGSLTAPITLHAVNNAFAFASLVAS